MTQREELPVSERLELRLAFYFSRNNQPCMSGDPRDRLSPLQKRDLSDAVQSVMEELALVASPKSDDDGWHDYAAFKLAKAILEETEGGWEPSIAQAHAILDAALSAKEQG